MDGPVVPRLFLSFLPCRKHKEGGVLKYLWGLVCLQARHVVRCTETWHVCWASAPDTLDRGENMHSSYSFCFMACFVPPSIVSTRFRWDRLFPWQSNVYGHFLPECWYPGLECSQESTDISLDTRGRKKLAEWGIPSESNGEIFMSYLTTPTPFPGRKSPDLVYV